MKTKNTKRFIRTYKMRGIGYYIQDTLTEEMSNEHFVTISETNEFIKFLQKLTNKEIGEYFPRPINDYFFYDNN